VADSLQLAFLSIACDLIPEHAAAVTAVLKALGKSRGPAEIVMREMVPARDTAGVDSNAPRWSSDVRQSDWIAPRLAPWEGDYTTTVVVPAGFEAYTRVLHPAEVPEHGGRLVRWAEVAAWSGMPVRQDAQFHSIALPRTAPSEPPPYHGQGPRDGSLYVPDAEVLAGILRDWTAAPEDCWFCVWDGYGWESASSFFFAAASAETGQPPETVAPPKRDPVPRPVREAPRVQLPHRGYLLYQGPAAWIDQLVESLLAYGAASPQHAPRISRRPAATTARDPQRGPAH
jgi:hypothetical protein